MKKITAILLFFFCNALLVFLQVHKQGQYLKLSYEVQKLQSQIAQLKQEQNNLIYLLYSLQQPDKIQNFAQIELGMEPIILKTIKIAPSIKELHEVH